MFRSSQARWLLWSLWALGCSASQEPAHSSGGAPGTASTGGSTQESGGSSGGVAVSAGGATNTSGGLTGTGGAGTGGNSVQGGAAGSAGAGSGGASGGASNGGGGASSGGASGGSSSGGGASGGNSSGGRASGGATSGGSAMGGTATGGSASGGRAAGGTAAGGSATGGAASAGSSGYRPCPTDGSACKILPFGDSITWGIGDEANAGYRGPLFGLAVAAQQKITFTGSLSNGPSSVSSQAFPKKNEGHSGWTISTVNQFSGSNAGVAALVPSPALDSASGGQPHIILMMIGTNDVSASTSSKMSSDLAALIDKLTGAAPNALLVVAKITPLSWADAVIKPYNDSIPNLVQTRANAGKHIVLADMYTGFTLASMMSSDNIHPNATGYKFMADRWYSVIGPMLPK
ncbi:MAG: SGNH/GDSL hydrolase family protein [Polyangiaceae bacterium]